jgi:hypothetical protein
VRQLGPVPWGVALGEDRGDKLHLNIDHTQRDSAAADPRVLATIEAIAERSLYRPEY